MNKPLIKKICYLFIKSLVVKKLLKKVLSKIRQIKLRKRLEAREDRIKSVQSQKRKKPLIQPINLRMSKLLLRFLIFLLRILKDGFSKVIEERKVEEKLLILKWSKIFRIGFLSLLSLIKNNLVLISLKKWLKNLVISLINSKHQKDGMKSLLSVLIRKSINSLIQNPRKK